MAEKKKKSFLRKLLLPAVIILLVLVFLRIYIPIYIEYNLCDKLSKSLKVGEISCRVRSFGFSHLDLTDIMVGEVKTPFLRSDYVRIDYPFLGVFGCAISVSGLTLDLRYNDGKLSIPGMKIEDFMAGSKEGSRSSSNAIPKFIKYLSVSNSCVNVDTSGNRYMIPFEFFAWKLPGDSGDARKNDYELNLELNPRGESLRIYSVSDPELKKFSTELNAEKINLARFQDITDNMKGLKVSAMASISSKFELPDSNADMKLTLSDLDFQYKSVRITNSTDVEGKPVPFVLQIGRRGASVPFTFNSFRMQAPFPVDFSMDEPGGELKITDSGITVATEIKVKIDSDQFNSRFKSGGFKLRESESMTLLFDAGVKKSMDWNFNFSALHDRNELIELEGTNQTLSCKPEMISVSGEGDRHSALLNYVVKLNEMEWKKKGGAPTSLASMDLSGNFKADVLVQPLLIGSARLVLGNISAGPAKCEKIEAVIPYQYPIVADGKSDREKGSVKTSIVTVGDSKMGCLESELEQAGDMSWKVNGGFNTVFDGLKAGVAGELGMRELKGFFFKFDFDVNEPDGGLTVDFGNMNPAYSGIMGEGVLKAKGMAAYEAGIMKTGAEIKLSGGKVDAPSKKLKAEGIELSLSLQDLVSLKSLPKQRLKFTKVALGNFHLESGRIDFQLEAPKKYFVEKGGFSWCGGNVNLNAMRIIPGENLVFTLYCDRLNLASFLQQMKIAEATGDGTVNGRIPMVIGGKGRSLKIRNGFLYSTPGVGGVISFARSDMLQLAMAAQDGISITNFLMDVLKNFKYDWAKISMNSDQGDLKMLLQISGLPADKFAYNASDATFVKIEKDEGDIVRFQGIQYDINFNIPFNTLMEMEGDFSAILEEIEEGLK